MTSFHFRTEEAKTLPPSIRFGTSTWTYPGWKGLIYKQEYKSDRAFRSRSLGEYAQFPLFRTVGVDRSFYSPLSPATLREYASLVPDDFQWVSKAWERITIPQYPKHARYGKYAGQRNPDFLNTDLFCSEFLAGYYADEIQPHTGPFVFQFPTISQPLLEEVDFFATLKTFLQALPADFSYAVEIRNPKLLGKEYFDVLNSAGVTHCFNHWNYMPPLKQQMKLAAEAGGISAPFFVARILTPHGMNYQQAVKMFEPYDQLQRPDPEMRQDVVRLVRRALKRGSRAFVIVNNRCEGNSPMTISEIIGMLAEEP